MGEDRLLHEPPRWGLQAKVVVVLGVAMIAVMVWGVVSDTGESLHSWEWINVIVVVGLSVWGILSAVNVHVQLWERGLRHWTWWGKERFYRYEEIEAVTWSIQGMYGGGAKVHFRDGRTLVVSSSRADLDDPIYEILKERVAKRA